MKLSVGEVMLPVSSEEKKPPAWLYFLNISKIRTKVKPH